MARASDRSSAIEIRFEIQVDGYIHVAPARVAPELTALAFWRSFDPDLRLEPYHDRGAEGMRWYLHGGRTRTVGTAEVWLEQYRDGTVAHLFVRATVDARRGDAGSGAQRAWEAWRARRALARAEAGMRRALFEAKDRLEGRYPEPGFASLRTTSSTGWGFGGVEPVQRDDVVRKEANPQHHGLGNHSNHNN